MRCHALLALRHHYVARSLANMNVSDSESRNPRRPPEETGPFGRRRNARYETARSRTRTGTPAKKENPNVAEFG